MKLLCIEPCVSVATDDPERAVTPSIVYASAKEGDIVAHTILIGWWKWGVGIQWAVLKERK